MFIFLTIFMGAIASLPDNSILLIEDVDALFLQKFFLIIVKMKIY